MDSSYGDELALHSLHQTLRSLGPTKLAVTLAVSAGSLALLFWIAFRIATPGFDDLATQDHRQGDLALSYAASPTDASLGYEVFDRANGGDASAFVETVNRLRALEGELARSIAAIDRIERARVHLVLPEIQAASDRSGRPSASVLLETTGPLPLAKAQIGAIQHLLATAVPGLLPQAISVVDDKGNLLARGDSAEELSAAASRSEELRVAYEQRMAQAIEALLAPTLGPDNVRAHVSARLNFDRLTETAEIFDPDGQVLRSSNSVEEINNLSEATTNTDESAASNSAPQSERNEEAIDYEVSSTTRTQVRQGGKLERLSVAVMVNGTSLIGEDGATQYRPRSSSEMAQIEGLVRAAAGIDESRGDRLDVVNLPFAAAASVLPAVEAPGFSGLIQPDMLRLIEIAALVLIALAVIIFIVRPLIARNFGPFSAVTGGSLPQDAQSSGAVLDEMPLSGDGAFALAGRSGAFPNQGRAAHRVGEIVRAHPEAAITVVRSWLHREV